MSDDLHHLAAAYAVDALDDQERQAFEAHYPSCEICSQEVLEFSETASALATSVAMSPPADLKASLLAEIAETRQLPPKVTPQVTSKRRRWASQAVAAAAALLLVGGLVGALLSRSGRTDPITEVVSAPDAFVTTLEGTQGTLQVVYSGERDQVAHSLRFSK